MTMSRWQLIFLVGVFSPHSWADTAKCTIEVEDVNAEVELKAATKYVIEQTFSFNLGTGAQRKHFDLPDGRYSCTLAFFDLNSGTALSCGRKTSEHTFVQSDRSDIHEQAARNNLTFRDGNSYFVLNAACK